MSESGKILKNESPSISQSERITARQYRQQMIDELHNDVLQSLRDGMKFRFTESNKYPHDNWLIFSGQKSHTVTLKRGDDDVWMVHMQGEEPIRLEDTPNNFWASIRKHIQEKRYK